MGKLVTRRFHDSKGKRFAPPGDTSPLFFIEISFEKRKVIIYAYTQRIYFSRQMAKAVRKNVMFMWIAGRQRPDFRTINHFRSKRMKDVLEAVFTAVLEFLVKENYVKLEHDFVDGTKIESRRIRAGRPKSR